VLILLSICHRFPKGKAADLAPRGSGFESTWGVFEKRLFSQKA
jgi:hypothetical protein